MFNWNRVSYEEVFVDCLNHKRIEINRLKDVTISRNVDDYKDKDGTVNKFQLMNDITSEIEAKYKVVYNVRINYSIQSTGILIIKFKTIDNE